MAVLVYLLHIPTFGSYATPAAIAGAAILYPTMTSWWRERRLLNSCERDLRSDKRMLLDDHFTRKKFGVEITDCFWFVDVYRRVLREAPNQNDFDTTTLRGLVTAMELDNALAIEFDALDESDMDGPTKKKFERHFKRRHNNQRQIREMVDELLLHIWSR